MKSFAKYILPLIVVGLIAAGAHLHETADRPLAFVQKFKPQVGVQNKSQLKRVKERGKPLFNGDTLRTNKNGFALVQFMDKSIAKVRPDSRLIVRGEIEDKQNTSTRIGLELGEIFLNVSEQGAQDFEVATNSSVASVKGTEFGASYDDYFWVKEGEVEVTVNQTGESVTIDDSTSAQVQDDGTIQTQNMSDQQVQQNDEKFSQMNEKMEPETIELRFIDQNGQQQVIEIKVFENEN